jgi:hypothetical protein
MLKRTLLIAAVLIHFDFLTAVANAAGGRFELDINGQPKIGENSARYADESFARAVTFAGQLNNPSYVSVKTQKTGRGEFRLTYWKPSTAYKDVEFGLNGAVGAGPIIKTEMKTATPGFSGTAYEEETTAVYWRLGLGVQKKYRFWKFMLFSLQAGVGAIFGETKRQVTTQDRAFIVPPNIVLGTQKRGFSGAAFEFIPSIGVAVRSVQFKLGSGWAFYPKTNEFGAVPKLDLKSPAVLLSISW